jgi:hypothetical protein
MPAKEEEPAMERSRYLAGLIGPVMLALAATLLVNRAILPALVETVARDYALIMITGVIALVAGLAILMSHRVWRGWPLIISVLGVLAAVGGLLRLVFPAEVADLAGHVVVAGWPPLVAALLLAAIGAFLTFQAFFKRVPVP